VLTTVNLACLFKALRGNKCRHFPILRRCEKAIAGLPPSGEALKMTVCEASLDGEGMQCSRLIVVATLALAARA
jgi:hypothetical protein